MKRFEGLVLCADVDGTLINEENKVPKENLEAIEYFQRRRPPLLPRIPLSGLR